MKLLKIKTLNKGWCDKVELLLHGAFQLLTDFVEKEKPGELIDWNSDKHHRKVWKEIRLLYHWWKVKRPARKDPLDQKNLTIPPWKFKKIPGTDYSQRIEPDKKKYAKYYQALKKSAKLDQKWHEEDQRNLHRLIDIRDFLWT